MAATSNVALILHTKLYLLFTQMFDFKLMSPILWPVVDTLPPLKSPSKSCKSQENLNKSMMFSFKKGNFSIGPLEKKGGGGYKSPTK